jgi:hypothetical protein
MNLEDGLSEARRFRPARQLALGFASLDPPYLKKRKKRPAAQGPAVQ